MRSKKYITTTPGNPEMISLEKAFVIIKNGKTNIHTIGQHLKNKLLREQVATDDTQIQQASNITSSPKRCKTAIEEIIKKHTLDDTQASVIQELMTDASKAKQNLMLLPF